MFGTNLQLTTKQCVVCGKHIALHVDKDDLDRLRHGVLVQHALPYLDASVRELWISGVCGDCWLLLCPSDRLAYN